MVLCYVCGMFEKSVVEFETVLQRKVFWMFQVKYLTQLNELKMYLFLP